MENPLDQTRVLVVDDEQGIRDGAQRILSRMECEVLTADRGEKALGVLENQAVNIMLLDLKMPGMDGMEVLTRVRKQYPDLLVIVITGFATLETAVAAMKQGAYDFIPKPFEPDQLRIVINRARERLRLKREAATLARERSKTLLDLDTEKSRIRTILETLPDGLVVTNTQGQVVLMNPAFQWLLGLPPEKGPGEPIGAYVNDKGFGVLAGEISSCRLPGSGESRSYEFSPADGRYLMARGRPVLGEEGECLGAVINVMDITPMKVLDRLKSEFLAKVTHELRSPLSTIHEQLALVLREMAQEETRNEQHILFRAKEKTQGLISLIGDLLDLSRIEAGAVCQTPRPVEVERLLAGIVDFLGARTRNRNQTLTLKLPAEPLPTVIADPVALESIFGNLITNAINYTPDGGLIRVEVRQEGPWLEVQVIDNGFGIEARHLDQIFKRFYRVKTDKTRFVTGTGLGLPIVKGLLDELGGTIAVESETDKGSVFTVRLKADRAGANGK